MWSYDYIFISNSLNIHGLLNAIFNCVELLPTMKDNTFYCIAPVCYTDFNQFESKELIFFTFFGLLAGSKWKWILMAGKS